MTRSCCRSPSRSPRPCSNGPIGRSTAGAGCSSTRNRRRRGERLLRLRPWTRTQAILSVTGRRARPRFFQGASMDVIATIIQIIGLFLNVDKKISCWPMWMFGCVLWVAYGLQHELWPLTVLNVVFFFFNCCGWWKWARDAKVSKVAFSHFESGPEIMMPFPAAVFEGQVESIVHENNLESIVLDDTKTYTIQVPGLRLKRHDRGQCAADRRMALARHYGGTVDSSCHGTSVNDHHCIRFHHRAVCCHWCGRYCCQKGRTNDQKPISYHSRCSFPLWLRRRG